MGIQRRCPCGCGFVNKQTNKQSTELSLRRLPARHYRPNITCNTEHLLEVHQLNGSKKLQIQDYSTLTKLEVYKCGS